jgi:opacity protein-like surface antigen
MTRIARLLIGAALPFAIIGSAQAADVVYQEPVMAAPVAAAAPMPAFYLAGRVSGTFAEDTRFGVLGTTVTNDYNTIGFEGSLAIGTSLSGFGIPLRAELEGGYMRNGIDSHNIAGVGNFTGGDAFGSTNVLYGLANAYADFGDGPLRPYVGAGIGYARVGFDNHGVSAVGTALDDSGHGLAWQVGAGVSYDVTNEATVELGYRYFGVENVGLTAVDGTNSSVDVRAHQVRLGMRFAF